MNASKLRGCSPFRLRACFGLRHSSFVIAFFLMLASLLPHSARADEIPPPFGLQWGTTDDRLGKLLVGAKAKVTDKHTVDGREAWTVEGLVQPGLKRTVFYFKSGALVEVELQYENPAWDAAKYDEFMAQVRRRIEQKYGLGQLIARTKSPQGDVMQTVIGYKWNQNNTALELIYFCAEKAAQSYRTVSVHYKGS
jgi:hypothetical protein